MKRVAIRATKADPPGRWYGVLNCDMLTTRELDVLTLASKGLANKEIARELKMAEGTVKIHLHRVYQKLGVKSRYALAVLARKEPSGG